jgi:photosystem II stability/assembly factor-like uncharacterized protein
VAKIEADQPHFKICLIIAGLVLLLTGSTFFLPVSASDDAARWTKVNIPTEGSAGGWVLADGSNIQHLIQSGDGTLYACGQGLTYTLYQSTDGGLSWSHLGNVQDAIIGIAVSPHDTSTIYYATASSVSRSTDGGRTFKPLPASPGGAGSNHIEITSIAATWRDSNIIAIGTRDTDSSQFGGVYTLDEAEAIPTWTDTNIGSYDVYAVAFSPSYMTDCQLVAVVTDETDTLVTTRIDDGDWGETTGDARLDKDNSGTPIPVAVAFSAAIVFPGDYDATLESDTIFVAIDTGTGQGDVYRISAAEAPHNSEATDLNAGADDDRDNVDITGLAVGGDTPPFSLMAGAADSTRTYFSADGGKSWTHSRKEPTGESGTYVLMAPESGKAYAATSGDESALSISQDNGDTWNQVSLIDTALSTIVSLAPSPRYSQDKTLFLLTFGGEHSLWRSQDGGSTWARAFSSAMANVDSLHLVGLPSQYSDSCQTVFIGGESDGRAATWKSTDNAQSFRRRLTRDPTTGAAFPIDTWAVVDDNTLLLASYDGSHGLVYKTTNSGLTYSEGAPADNLPLNTIALSPGYLQDKTMLVGNTNGWVYWSDDDGTSFEPLPADATSPPLTGSIAVAFDPDFASNHTVYAASDNTDQGVYRFTIGTSTDWEGIDSTLPSGAKLNQLTFGGGGTLYAVNADADGGMERCLNPSYSPGPTFETVTRSLSDGATLSGLWSSGNRLWTTDTTNIRLMTFNDTFTAPVTVSSPDDTAAGIGSLVDHTIRNISLDWETLEGATSYEWQLAYDRDLASIPDGLDGTTQASSTHLPDLEPAATYHWRVRAKTPVLSPWSEKRSFTTSLDTETISLSLENPQAGASGVPVKPVFQWTAVAGADAYELLVSAEADFTSPAIIKEDDYALPATAWQSNLSLDYDTTYYWKVRAISASTRSDWSAVSAFTTEPPPTSAATVPTNAPPAPAPKTTATPLPTYPAQVLTASPTPTPAAAQLPGITDWIIYFIGGLLAIAILALIITLTIVLKMRRF